MVLAAHEGYGTVVANRSRDAYNRLEFHHCKSPFKTSIESQCLWLQAKHTYEKPIKPFFPSLLVWTKGIFSVDYVLRMFENLPFFVHLLHWFSCYKLKCCFSEHVWHYFTLPFKLIDWCLITTFHNYRIFVNNYVHLCCTFVIGGTPSKMFNFLHCNDAYIDLMGRDHILHCSVSVDTYTGYLTPHNQCLLMLHWT